MNPSQFVMDTKGYCLLCLKLSRVEENNQDDENQIFSLQRVCHYLRVDLIRIFDDLVAATTSTATTSLSVLNKSELKGVLCEECSQMNKTISDITLELEVLQMTLDSLVKQMRDKVKGVGKDPKLLDRFEREMLSGPQTLLHYQVVEQFRRETLKKCSQMIKNAQPRVHLKRCAVGKPGLAQTPPPVDDADEIERNLECKFCKKSFRHKWLRADHEKTFHRETQFQCDICPKTFMFRVGLVRHRKRSHDGGPVKQTKSRSRSTSVSENAIMSPVPTPGDLDSTSNPGPPNPFEGIPLKLQSKDKKLKQTFQCQFCPESFSLRTTLLMHRYQEHKRLSYNPDDPAPAPSSENDKDKIATTCSKPAQMRKPEPPFKCEFCPVQFSHERSIYRHMTNFHNYQGTRKQLATAIREVRSQLSCNTDGENNCQLQTPGEDIENEGMPNQLSDFPLEAGDDLGSKLNAEPISTRQQMTDPPHLQNEFSEPSNSKTTEHEILSTLARCTQRPIHQVREGPKFQCQFCPASYSTKASLKMHRYRKHRHMQLRPHQPFKHKPKGGSSKFQCKYCPMGFSSPSNRLRHMKNFHNHLTQRQRVELKGAQSVAGSKVELEPGSYQNYKCRHCHRPFAKRSSLNHHVTIAHLGPTVERKYECATCGKRFVRSDGLLMHRKTVHLGERYPCPLCSTLFTQPGTMKYHMKHVCPKRNP